MLSIRCELRPAALLSVLTLGVTSCVGSIGDGSPEGNGVKDLTPEAASLVGVSGLRRLTVDEYDNTLRDLLGDKTRPGVLLLPDDVRTPFDNDYTNQVASQALIEGAAKPAGDAVRGRYTTTLRRTTAGVPESRSDPSCLRCSRIRRGVNPPF